MPLEVCGHLICRMLYITSLAGLLHLTLVWRFQKATNIPVQGGPWPVCPLMPWHYWYSFTPEWGEALSIWSKGVLNPSYLSFDSGQSWTHNLSHMSQELYHCATEAHHIETETWQFMQLSENLLRRNDQNDSWRSRGVNQPMFISGIGRKVLGITLPLRTL